MADKKLYTQSELDSVVEKSINVNRRYEGLKNYFNNYTFYSELERGMGTKSPTLNELKLELNNVVEDCEKVMPKSLINKLGIKKIE